MLLVVASAGALGERIGTVANRKVLPEVRAIGQFLQQGLVLQLDLQGLIDVGLARGGHLAVGGAGVEGGLDVDESVLVLQPVLADLLEGHQPAHGHSNVWK